MNLEEVRLLIKQIGKELYEDNPERQARGPFSVDKYDGPMTREQKLADVEAYQTEMLEKQAYRDALMDLEDSLVDASPSVGEKLIADFINLYPMGKRGSAGIGSLLGKEIGGMSEAEALRIKDIEQKIYELNSVYQKEGRGLKEIEALEGEKQGIMSMLSKIPLSPETQARNLISETPLSPETQARNAFKPGGETFLQRPLTPAETREWEQDFAVFDEKQFVSKAFAQRNPTVVNPIKGTSEWFDLTLNEAELQKLSAEDTEIAKDVIKRKKWDLKRMPEVQMYGDKEKREVHRDIEAQFQPYLDILNKKIKGLKAGGYVMNYGDYGRNYT